MNICGARGVDPGVSAVESDDLKWMRLALEEARSSRVRGDVGVGAVLVVGSRLLARGGNSVLTTGDVTAHAEMVAIRQLRQSIHHAGVLTLYATFDPCPMCAGAALCAGVERIVVGGQRTSGDLTWGSYVLKDWARYTAGQRLEVVYGALEEECVAVRGGATGSGACEA